MSIDWEAQARIFRDQIELSAQDISYERRADLGNPFTVRGSPATPGESDLTEGVTLDHKMVVFAPEVFLAASGDEPPRKGDLLTFGGRKYAVDQRPRTHRRGGVDLRYDLFCKG